MLLIDAAGYEAQQHSRYRDKNILWFGLHLSTLSALLISLFVVNSSHYVAIQASGWARPEPDVRRRLRSVLRNGDRKKILVLGRIEIPDGILNLYFDIFHFDSR